jgi:hypothetical protein
MKIRNGFVSNSSSSSFVVCGIKIGNTKEVLEKVCRGKCSNYEEVEDFLDEHQLGIRYYDRGYLIGEVHFIEEGEVVEIGIDDKTKQKILENLKKVGLEGAEIKIYSGLNVGWLLR